MQALSSWNHRLGLCLIVVSVLVATDSVRAQGQCTCRASRSFAECANVLGLDFDGDDNSYPDLFPGTGTVVTEDGSDTLYVADLFSGRVYTYKYQTQLLESIKLQDLVISSPAGSQATTGLTFLNDFLVWAVTNNREDDGPTYEIWRTDILGAEPIRLGSVDMAALADLVLADTGDETIVVGRLGGIVYHPTRNTLWGVDIVNDLYFELETNGDLVLDGEGKPNYFFNPLRNTVVGGAYGNDITYLSNADGEFFDIPIGALSDGRASRVTRVRAAAGEGFDIGDETGVFYLLDDNLESPQFVTGIVFWPDSCSTGEHSELIFDIDLSGGPPRVIEVSADDPGSGSVGGFSCQTDEADRSAARLTWTKDFMYTSLEITRRDIREPPGSAEVVFNTNFDDDPEEFLDGGLLTGTYEYTLTVEGVEGGPNVPQTCRVNIGRGRIVNLAPFDAPGSDLPYAATIVPGDNLVVVDLETGEAMSFDLALNPTGPVARPQNGGLATGVAFNSTDGLLYYMQNDGGSHFLTGVTLDGEGETAPVRVDVPFNFERGLQLGDIAYDALRDWFWTIDLRHQVILAIQPDGDIPAVFQTQQISLDDPNFTLTGGLALVASVEGSVTFDLVRDQAATGLLGDYVRMEFDLTTSNQTEVFSFDLVSALDTGDVGGLAVAGSVGYVVAMGSALIYALQVESEGLTFFRRGDVNDDGAINLSDPSALLGSLFLGAAAPPCDAAADTNADNVIQLADAVLLFDYLFAGGEMPAPPFPTCGVDANTTLSCARSSSCAP